MNINIKDIYYISLKKNGFKTVKKTSLLKV